MIRITIPVDKIGALIGPGGKTIRSIIETTGASVDVENDGSVIIGTPNAEAANRAVRMVEALTKDVEVGQVYKGKVTRIMNFGAFVEILPGKEGLVHISELDTRRVPSVEDVVKVGDELEVMVIELDRMGRINLSRRALLEPSSSDDEEGGDTAARTGPSSNGERGFSRERPGGGDRRPAGGNRFGDRRSGPPPRR